MLTAGFTGSERLLQASQSLNGNEPVIKWNKHAGHVTHLDFGAKHESQSSFRADQY